MRFRCRASYQRTHQHHWNSRFDELLRGQGTELPLCRRQRQHDNLHSEPKQSAGAGPARPQWPDGWRIPLPTSGERGQQGQHLHSGSRYRKTDPEVPPLWREGGQRNRIVFRGRSGGRKVEHAIPDRDLDRWRSAERASKVVAPSDSYLSEDTDTKSSASARSRENRSIRNTAAAGPNPGDRSTYRRSSPRNFPNPVRKRTRSVSSEAPPHGASRWRGSISSSSRRIKSSPAGRENTSSDNA